MSLINDALKRAGQAKTPPSQPAQTEPPLRPVEYKRPSRWALFLLPVLLLVLALGGWFFVRGWQAQRSAALDVNKTAIEAREISDRGPNDSANQISTQTNSSVGATASSSTNVQVVEPAQPTFPAVRLQGIFYRTRNPSVMINFKTVSVGEKVANAKVVAITRNSVTLAWNGETKVLTLE